MSYSLNFTYVFLLLEILDIVHPNIFLKAIVRMNIKSDEVKNGVKLEEVNDGVKSGIRLVVFEVGVREQFTNKQEFIVREHMLQRVHTEVEKLGFG